MPAQWTADVIGQMHLYGITSVMLATELDWHPKYLSKVLNSPNPPAGSEEKVRKALESVIEKVDVS